MVSFRKSWRMTSVGAFVFIVHFSLGTVPELHALSNALSAGVDAAGTITIIETPKAGAQSLELGAISESCEAGICDELFPKDGMIEGKRVLAMNPAGVNSRGQVVGLCVLEGDSGKYAFVREADGRVWIFHPPASNGQGEFTDISDSGLAVGIYEKGASRTKIGFLMNPRKQLVADIAYPSNPCPSVRAYLHTQPNGINDEGEIVGNYDCTASPNDPADALFKGNGFFRAADGTFYRVQYENAARTVAGKISNLGVIVGYYVMDNDVWIPFAAQKEEVIQPINP